ncbi:MAG TPA: fatty acid desaturase [Acidimicrobiales bacterium]|nr:fatty acid desaturase [Acidimicrobiales bacterium]
MNIRNRRPASSRELPRHTTLRLLIHVSTYAALTAIGFVLDRWPIWVVIWCLQVVLLVGCASVAHYASHGTLYETRLANRLVGMFFYAPLLINYSCDQAYHRQHHAHTRVEGDTEPYFEAYSFHMYFLGLVFGGASFVLENWLNTIRTLVGRPPKFVRSSARRKKVALDALFVFALVTLLVLLTIQWPGAMLRIWLAPFLLTILGGSYLIVLPEHFRCPRSTDTMRNTRTVRSNAVMRYFLFNGPMHTAHHAEPIVPFDRLPALSRSLEPAIEHVSPSYTRFHLDVVRALAHGDRGAISVQHKSAVTA